MLEKHITIPKTKEATERHVSTRLPMVKTVISYITVYWIQPLAEQLSLDHNPLSAIKIPLDTFVIIDDFMHLFSSNMDVSCRFIHSERVMLIK